MMRENRKGFSPQNLCMVHGSVIHAQPILHSMRGEFKSGKVKVFILLFNMSEDGDR